MTRVVALGGNALARRGEPITAAVQRRNVELAAEALVPLLDSDEPLVITHGNGPQVGLLMLESEADTTVGAYPLDVLGAETEGMIGYLLEQALTRRVASHAVRDAAHPDSRLGGRSRDARADQAGRAGVRPGHSPPTGGAARIHDRARHRWLAAGRAVSGADQDSRAERHPRPGSQRHNRDHGGWWVRAGRDRRCGQAIRSRGRGGQGSDRGRVGAGRGRTASCFSLTWTASIATSPVPGRRRSST